MQCPAAEFGKDVKVEQLDIFRPHRKVILRNRSPLQGPTVSGYFVIRLDQPQRASLCKPLLDISASLLGIPETSNLLQIGLAKVLLTPQPVDSHRAGDVHGTHRQIGQITVKDQHAARKDCPLYGYACALNRRPKTVEFVVSR